jgi:hypothetical protein
MMHQWGGRPRPRWTSRSGYQLWKTAASLGPAWTPAAVQEDRPTL